MRKIFIFIAFAGLCFACGDDDDSLSQKPVEPSEKTDTTSKDSTKTDTTKTDTTKTDTIPTDSSEVALADSFTVSIAYSGSTVTVSGETDSLKVSSNGAHLTIVSNSSRFMELSISGGTTDGSLLVYSQKKFGIILNDVNITNPKGPAINNQCGKSLYLTLNGTSMLSDGTTYGAAPTDSTGTAIDQKGTLFSEGQIYFRGNGTLNVYGYGKNGIASDDYIIFESGNVSVKVDDTGSNGVKVNDGLEILGGTLTIDVAADGARGIKNDAYMTVSGGTTTITTNGDCLIETVGGVRDTTSCAGIKCDSVFTMTAGKLTTTSTGDGGKGVNALSFKLSGGTFLAQTTGSNDVGKPKAVKCDSGIFLSGGSFKATCKKSWACDNGVETEEPSARVTVIGNPSQASYNKREMIVIF